MSQPEKVYNVNAKDLQSIIDMVQEIPTKFGFQILKHIELVIQQNQQPPVIKVDENDSDIKENN